MGGSGSHAAKTWILRVLLSFPLNKLPGIVEAIHLLMTAAFADPNNNSANSVPSSSDSDDSGAAQKGLGEGANVAQIRLFLKSDGFLSFCG